MGVKSVVIFLYISSCFYETVYCLTCLSCNRIIQPRHCHEVAVCSQDEVCGAEKLRSSMGFQAYQLGCVSKTTCTKGTSVIGVQCKQCCNGDLCNAALCGEPDYPGTRGPICYACNYHTDLQPCRSIQFCTENEECGIIAVDEFGDTVLTSGCKQKHACQDPNAITPVYIGKRAISGPPITPKPPTMSVTPPVSITRTLLSSQPITPLANHSLPPLSTSSSHVTQPRSLPTRPIKPPTPPVSPFTLLGIPPTLSSPIVKTTLPPASTTSVPVPTKSAPVSTTSARVKTTSAPVSTTTALVTFTSVSVTSMRPPVTASSAPSTTTASRFVCNKCCSQDLCNFNCSSTNLCATSSCKHGACVVVNSTATCVCSAGWCDNFDHCSSSPCIRGTCTRTQMSYTCSCTFGWSGRNCDVSVFTSYNCDFESGTCTWTQSRTDYFDWTRHSGSTGTSSTGPYNDHTTGTSNGHYMYIEASNAYTGNKADLVSKLIPPGPTGQSYCFALALNMYGSTMGSIDIYIKPERKTQYLIQHYKQITNDYTWHVRNLTIPAQPRNFSIVVEGVRGSGSYSDAAIDDLLLSPGAC